LYPIFCYLSTDFLEVDYMSEPIQNEAHPYQKLGGTIRHDPRFVRTWQLTYIGNAVSLVTLLTLHALYGYSEGTSPAYGLTMDMINVLVMLVSFLLWTRYYARSVRVRTYMGSDEYLRRAFFMKTIEWAKPAVQDAE